MTLSTAASNVGVLALRRSASGSRPAATARRFAKARSRAIASETTGHPPSPSSRTAVRRDRTTSAASRETDMRVLPEELGRAAAATEGEPQSPGRLHETDRKSFPLREVLPRPEDDRICAPVQLDRVRGLGGGDDPATTGRFSRDDRAD